MFKSKPWDLVVMVIANISKHMYSIRIEDYNRGLPNVRYLTLKYVREAILLIKNAINNSLS